MSCIKHIFLVFFTVSLTTYLIQGFQSMTLYKYIKIRRSLQCCRVSVLLKCFSTFDVKKDHSPEAFDSGTVRKTFKITSVLGNFACNPSMMYLCGLEGFANFCILTL
jgi:hypothetical protein